VTLPVLDRDEGLASLAASSRRYTDLLRSVEDPSAIAVGYWTVRDVAVHTSHVFDLFLRLLGGEHSPITDHLRMSEVWDARVEEDKESDLVVISERIDRAAEAFIAAATPAEWEQERWWHGDLRVPIHALTGILISEANVHGYDVASAAGRTWSISRKTALESISGLLSILPAFVNRDEAGDLKADFELRLRGGPPIYVSLVEGSLFLDATPKPVDCHVSAEPVDYMLVGFGRRSQWPAIAKGRIVAWGRKPWLSLKFAKLFYSP
jgi:uncharacterized protein (TIGR03083 family)